MYQRKVAVLLILIYIVLITGSPIQAVEDQKIDQIDQVEELLDTAEEVTEGSSQVDQTTTTLRSPIPKKTAQNVDLVQKQLDDVIRANQNLQEDYSKRMEKIQAISTQARIHQKILNNIKGKAPSPSSVVQQAVQQEKIRLIADQARKNHELLKTLRSSQQKSSQ